MAGEPSYIELGVGDVDLARVFFGGLLGWAPSGESGNGEVKTSGLSIGMHSADPRALFEVFFAVEDLEASMEQVHALGGNVTSEVNDVPGFGRWCECVDDQGTVFGLRQPS